MLSVPPSITVCYFSSFPNNSLGSPASFCPGHNRAHAKSNRAQKQQSETEARQYQACPGAVRDGHETDNPMRAKRSRTVYLWRGIFPSNRGHAGPPLSCREVIHRARHPIYGTVFWLSQQYVGFLQHILA